jgi:hypothetical protein
MKADAARQALSAAPETVAFLEKQLKAETVAVGKDEIARLIKDLDSNTFATREQATRELERLERAPEAALREALTGSQVSLELRRRMERLLERLDAPATEPERLRVHRSIHVLEEIASPEARQLLERLARGTPGASSTGEAREALDRLK